MMHRRYLLRFQGALILAGISFASATEAKPAHPSNGATVSGVVNINEAGPEQLKRLPHIGPQNCTTDNSCSKAPTISSSLRDHAGQRNRSAHVSQTKTVSPSARTYDTRPTRTELKECAAANAVKQLPSMPAADRPSPSFTCWLTWPDVRC